MNKSEINNIEPINKKDRICIPFCNEPQNRSFVANVLVVDNDKESTRFILEILARKGIRGTVAGSEKTVVDFLDKNNYDLVFSVTKINQSEDDFKLVREIKVNSPEMPVIMICDTQNQKSQNQQQLLDIAVKAVNAGCCNFLIKPLDREKIENLLDSFLPNHHIATADCVQQGIQPLFTIVGKSAKLIQTINLAKKIAPTSAPVLICGESGTGKELISFLIHLHSKRTRGPYVRVNCAALTDSLLESELFGHEKGAFTGAYAQRKGRFEMAHGGTLLLDEIAETPIKFQAKLLRVLEQQDFERVGGNDSIRVDVRIISTTNKDLLSEVAEGRFRQDLYYRLCGVRLIIPPLRQRSEDLSDLVWHFVNFYARQAQRYITGLDPAMMNIFAKYHWPGNIRQLRNVVLTSLILGTGPKLSLADVSWLFDELQPLPQENTLSISNGQTPVSELAGLPLDQVERQVILDTLGNTGGNQTKAAKILGISDRTLRSKIRRYHQKGELQLA
ncbi:MAG: sigma-54 dependent transcriptional regulator [Phycisphaerae bacterium]|nr:sigma-54 dependent transcriptional regulator [Phycisphaerae bacterium]